jgi:hypothetical protein
LRTGHAQNVKGGHVIYTKCAQWQKFDGLTGSEKSDCAMASKRVAKTAVDWEKFANGLRHEEAVQKMTAWKAQSGQYVSRIAQLPEALPKVSVE